MKHFMIKHADVDAQGKFVFPKLLAEDNKFRREENILNSKIRNRLPKNNEFYITIYFSTIKTYI